MLGLELGGAVIGAVHQSVGQKILQTRTALAGVRKRGQGHFHWHKPDALLYFSLETAIIQWLLHSQIFGGDHLPGLLINKLTTSDLPYLHSGQKALSPFHFYTGKNYIGCPPDEIYAFLGEIHWCSVQGPVWPQLWKGLMVQKGDEGWAAEHEWLFLVICILPSAIVPSLFYSPTKSGCRSSDGCCCAVSAGCPLATPLNTVHQWWKVTLIDVLTLFNTSWSLGSHHQEWHCRLLK